jgi:hypothetical protein
MAQRFQTLLCVAIQATFITGFSLPAYAEFNGKPCQCRKPGGKVNEGTVACISTPEGDKMMRCQMVLNNSAWVTLHDGCAIGTLEKLDIRDISPIVKDFSKG